MSTVDVDLGVLAPDRLREHVTGLEPISRFPAVDELIAQFDALAGDAPELVSRYRFGTSRLGEPIPAYRIGSGKRQHLIVGGVHPNEPVGGLTGLHLARLLCRHAELREGFGARWTIVPCIDPDGMRLNENWFAEPGDRVGYARHFYRPAPDEQVEWSFPLDYRRCYFDQVIPETAALMRAIDELRPDLLVSLHNSELGGAYFYLSRVVGDLPRLLQDNAAAIGLPLHTGEPEAPYLPVLADAVFGETPIETVYDYLESVNADPVDYIGGSSSGDYARRYGTLCVVPEAPQWSSPDADDQRPSALGYAAVLRTKAERLAEMAQLLSSALAAAGPHLSLATPWRRATQAFVPLMTQTAALEAARAEREDPTRIATVSEVFTATDLIHCFRLRYGGMLLRTLQAEVGAGVATAALRRVTADFAEVFDAWLLEAAGQSVDPVPLERLAGLQLGTVLLSAAVLADDLGAQQ